MPLRDLDRGAPAGLPPARRFRSVSASHLMEYTINLSAAPVDVDRVRDALEDIDPAAIVDLDPRGQGLRVAANMLDRELFGALERAGHPADTVEVVRLPSVCCGSCSG
ncbi:MAG: hypothetical protein RBT79_05640 [Chiayiivirga sp.]|nr:hypothetical protein [Chiayiivirga sp.]